MGPYIRMSLRVLYLERNINACQGRRKKEEEERVDKEELRYICTTTTTNSYHSFAFLFASYSVCLPVCLLAGSSLSFGG